MVDVAPGSIGPVTAVIPVHRNPAEARRALLSVYLQTMRPAEIIVVDDASNDIDTANALQGVAAERPKGTHVRILSLQRNVGPGEARNYAWERSCQPFVAFLDSDDTWLPRKVEAQLRVFREAPHLSVVGHRAMQSCQAESDRLAICDRAWQYIGMRQMLIRNRFPTSSVMLRSDLTCRFPAGRRYSEDYALWLDILSSGRRGALMDDRLVCYYKPFVGDTGLSSRVWQMEKEELRILGSLAVQERLGYVDTGIAMAWSAVRYLRRAVIVGARRSVNSFSFRRQPRRTAP